MILALVLYFMSAICQADTNLAYSTIGPLIFQVKTAASENSEKSSYGSGFVVDQHGLLITNYHVVVDHIWNNDSSKIYVKIDGKNFEATVMKIDVINDLALIKVDHTFSQKIVLAKNEPANGDQIFTLGLPEDLEWTVVAGVYNGLTKSGPRDLFYMSTALNHGMCGGPTVNSKYELVAVNASVKKDGALISFGVPLQAVKDIIASPDVFEGNRLQVIEKQLTDFQEKMTTQILTGITKAKKLKGVIVPDFTEWFKCWGSTENAAKSSVEKQTEYCGNDLGSIMVSDDVEEGFFNAFFGSVTNKSLNPFAWQENKSKDVLATSRKYLLADFFNSKADLTFSKPKCKNQNVKNGSSFITTDLCFQKLNEFNDILDSKITLFKPLGSNKYLFARFGLYGFSRKNILKITSALTGFDYENPL